MLGAPVIPAWAATPQARGELRAAAALPATLRVPGSAVTAQAARQRAVTAPVTTARAEAAEAANRAPTPPRLAAREPVSRLRRTRAIADAATTRVRAACVPRARASPNLWS